MAGLKKENLTNEVLTELSWIMNVIDDLCEKTGLETYQSTLIKYRIQPEEEHALNQYLFLHWRELDTLTTQDIRQGVAALFCEHTGKKPWSRPDDVLEKRVTLWQEYTGLCTHEATSAERA